MQQYLVLIIFTGMYQMYTIHILYDTLLLHHAQATSPDGGWCKFLQQHMIGLWCPHNYNSTLVQFSEHTLEYSPCTV
ncbi:uncharacterized protein EURHEDRAFT_254098 [Aspergillus ruber CBS 135680]|uniref:Uncharacterized protein n=1 Tax=Aspergillus ruber (strain CBS 135680) TaxID=1388766 RepID=A0A017S296_ASPRC|nr:uncharacterized protein EURHEDRAFT_254098 [Aspergillus ruber CBS 135680]EYE91158.1 hypothetical protein EURHEDRAFT_254098 [Aspergillus ruber CBS 135680]